MAGFTGSALAVAPSMGDKHDAHTPIEVTSDALEVQQDKNMAIFTGHVVAIQGDVRLKSDKMTVHYRKPEDKGVDAKAAPAPAALPGQQQNAIQHIDAEGNVFLTTATETASGETGIYDVEHQEIHLNNNVVLTHGQNVLRGNALVYHFDSGQSVLTGGEQTVPGAGGKARVRALFVPEQQKEKK